MEHSLKRMRDEESKQNASSSRVKHFCHEDTPSKVKHEEEAGVKTESSDAGLDLHSVNAEQLKKDGYVTIRMLSKEACAAQRDAFTASFLTFPEYLRHPSDPTRTPTGEPIIYVAGGYGGLGNPASYHCDNAREIRECVFAGAIPLLGALSRLSPIPEWEAVPFLAKKQIRVAAFMERNSVRSAGTTVGADSCHFDSSPEEVLKPGDQVFGCIVNINDEPIPFRCVPGTHLAMPSWKAVGTFEPVRDPVLLARYAAEMVEVTILPGCAIVFYQHIVHEVAKPKRALVADSYRFMCGLLLTRETTPPFDVTDVIKRQAVPQIKSGQFPPIYSKNHRSAFLKKPFTLRKGYKDTLLGWCEKTFKPSLLVEKTHGTTGEKYRILPMVMPSLADAGLPMYRDYTAEELAVFYPSSDFFLKTFDSNGARKHFRL